MIKFVDNYHTGRLVINLDIQKSDKTDSLRGEPTSYDPLQAGRGSVLVLQKNTL